MGKKYASMKRRPKTEASPSPATIAHNQRFVQPTDLLPEEHRLPNYHLTKISNATKTFQSWDAENKQRYQEKNGRKLRSDAITLESMAIILSCDQVKKIDPDKIWQSAIKFKEWFEERYQTKVRTLDWHRDEGYINEDGEVERNEHVHLEFDNVNADGKMVRRLFSKGDLVGFQDKIAEIYKPLGFIRGEDTAKKVATDEPKRGIAQKDWKKIKKSVTQKSLNSEIKNLKTEITKILAETDLSNQEKRAEYAKLEQLNRDLKERVKAKDLTIDQLQEELSNFYADDAMPLKKEGLTEFEELELENTSLKAENQALKHEISTLPSQDTFNDLKERLKAFEDAVAINQALVPLEVENERLRKQLKLLEDEEFKPFKLGRGDLLLRLEQLAEQLMSYEINDGLDIDIAEGIAMSQDKTTPTPHGF